MVARSPPRTPPPGSSDATPGSRSRCLRAATPWWTWRSPTRPGAGRPLRPGGHLGRAGAAGVAISGQWMEYDGMGRAEALMTLAAPEHALLAEAPPSMGTCRLLDAEAGRPGPGGQIDLLDAGPLRVAAPAPSWTRCSWPAGAAALVAALAGVVYDADAELRTSRAAGTPSRPRGPTSRRSAPRSSRRCPPGSRPTSSTTRAWRSASAAPPIPWSCSRGRPAAARSSPPAVPSRGADTLRIPPEALRHLGAGPASRLRCASRAPRSSRRASTEPSSS
ncbi:MAG: hypothetical protein R3F43_19615 [bacterium]